MRDSLKMTLNGNFWKCNVVSRLKNFSEQISQFSALIVRVSTIFMFITFFYDRMIFEYFLFWEQILFHEDEFLLVSQLSKPENY